ncbi:PREDICTED: uncharacterized protein LOC109350370 [Lupinus angustifolius]|uniref:uncharacterized protein LOC109350370 n=1 Tax=Lupinus angustifolius TaxID=3871 RepID=UPI00092E9136|nr:PREDICTED: uncharacterized protein LOC109350370 [Lupinus angustifolius]
MGNCMETCTLRQQDDAVEIQKQHQHDEETGRTNGFVKINGDDDKGKKKNVLRVKVVLTKEELKWLMLQLNNDKEGMKLEQALEEIEKSRDRKVHEGWKPSLESILEAPEMLQIHTRFP